MTITADQMLTVLKIAKTFDNYRPAPTSDEADAWLAMFRINNLRVTDADARRVVMDYYAHPQKNSISVAVFMDEVRKIRNHRNTKNGDETPPDEVADDPVQTRDWLRTYRRAIGDGHEQTNARAIANQHMNVIENPRQITSRPGNMQGFLQKIDTKSRRAMAPGPDADRTPTHQPNKTYDDTRPVPDRDAFLAQVSAAGIPTQATEGDNE